MVKERTCCIYFAELADVGRTNRGRPCYEAKPVDTNL